MMTSVLLCTPDREDTMQNDQESSSAKVSEPNTTTTMSLNRSLYFAAIYTAAAFIFILVAMSEYWVHDKPNTAMLCVIASALPATFAGKQLHRFVMSQHGDTSAT